MEIGYTSISLFFGEPTRAPSRYIHAPVVSCVPDLAAFVVIICYGLKSGLHVSAVTMSKPNLIKTIVHDATIYFFIIFTSHLILVFSLVFARVRTRQN